VGSAEGPFRPRRFLSAVRLLLAVQRRAGFLHVYAGVTVVTVLVLRLALPVEWRAWAVPAVLLGEYGTMGLFLTAAHRYLERIEGSDAALVVTPLQSGEQVAAMVAAPALVATISGVVLFGAILGLDVRLLLLLPPLGLTATLAGALGIVLASRHAEFTRFLVAAVPVVTVFSLPYLSYFGVTPRWSFAWLPWDAALFAFAALARDEAPAGSFGFLVLELGLFAGVALLWADRCHRRGRAAVGEGA
jgi:hypothetical protein